MRSIRRASRALPIITGLLSAAPLVLRAAIAAEAPRSDGIAALAARTPTAVGHDLPAKGGMLPGILAVCAAGVRDSCFEASPARLINVGAFFDRRRPSQSSHFMIKYFEPPVSGRVRVDGFTFTCNRAAATFASCGAVRTSRAAPTFPSSDNLRQLQRLFVPSAGANVPTCVDLAATPFELEADQSCWLVLQFADPPDTNFVGVVADGDMNDNPCDFLSRDSGEFWFRPDPRQSPLDWSFIAHYTALPAKQQRWVPWTAIKRLHQ